MKLPRWLGVPLGGVTALAATLALAALSRAPYHPYRSADAMLRLAWSARPERIEQCRRQSDEELAQLPAHMRLRVVCEGTSARYRLEVLRDGKLVVDDTVRGGGVRHDRPLYLLRELRLPPGSSRLEIRFSRIDHPSLVGDTTAVTPGFDSVGALPPGRERREEEERERRRREVVPARLVFASTVRLGPREVLLVTYNPARRALIAITGEPVP